MAEALAAVGVVASIVQLVDIGTRVLARMNDYQAKQRDISSAFRHTQLRLPVLLDVLKKKQAALSTDTAPEDVEKNLQLLTNDCFAQIQALDAVITKALPAPGDSWARRSKKALRSLRYDGKVEQIDKAIEGHIRALMYHAIASSSPFLVKDTTRPIRCSTVPFRRDSDFIDRFVLADANRKISQPASRVALVGLGGVGKSQLAIELSYRVRDQDPQRWVFWIHCGTRARFEADYRRIADVTRPEGWNDPQANTLSLVKNWLCNESNGQWTMVVDNADDSSIFFSSPERPGQRTRGSRGRSVEPLSEFLPQSLNGNILITTRDRDLACRLTGSPENVIPVDPMGKVEATALLRKKIQGSHFDHDDGEALVEILECMPLAIAQAAAYINQRAPRATVARYVHDLRGCDRTRAKLLGKDLGDLRRDGTQSNSIILTWIISFEHIRREQPTATSLLSLMSMFDSQKIPESLLSERYQDDDASHDTDSSYSSVGVEERFSRLTFEDSLEEFDFDDDVETLMNYSLVTMDCSGNYFAMHRLAQFSTREWLKQNHELEYWKEKYVQLLQDNFPCSDRYNWAACKDLLPHVQAAVDLRPHDPRALQTWASVIEKAGRYAVHMHQFDRARDLYSLALQARETTSGTDHQDTISTLLALGDNFHRLGEYARAEAIARDALEKGRRTYGENHRIVLESSHLLLRTYRAQGKSTDVLDEQQQLLNTMQTRLGKEDPTTIYTMIALAKTHKRLGQWNEAERLMVKAIDILKEDVGVKCTDTLAAMLQLGNLYWRGGKFNKADEVLAECLKLHERFIGKDHPSTLEAMHNLAFTKRSLGQIHEATTLMKSCYQLRKKALGSTHEVTKRTLAQLKVFRKEVTSQYTENT